MKQSTCGCFPDRRETGVYETDDSIAKRKTRHPPGAQIAFLLLAGKYNGAEFLTRLIWLQGDRAPAQKLKSKASLKSLWSSWLHQSPSCNASYLPFYHPIDQSVSSIKCIAMQIHSRGACRFSSLAKVYNSVEYHSRPGRTVVGKNQRGKAKIVKSYCEGCSGYSSMRNTDVWTFSQLIKWIEWNRSFIETLY